MSLCRNLGDRLDHNNDFAMFGTFIELSLSLMFIIDCEARKIIHLVASVHLSVCAFVGLCVYAKQTDAKRHIISLLGCL